jgi:hypothetical protein
MEERLEATRETGGDGLIAELVRVEKEGRRISRDEMVAMLFLLLFPGHETTTHLISGSVRELLRNPGLRDWLEEDWSRAELAVEEFLRFVSPMQFTKPALRAKGRGAWRRPVEEGGQNHAHAGRRELRSASQRTVGESQSRKKAEPARRLRRRDSFLSGSSARAYRRQVRATSPVRALAEARAGHRGFEHSLAHASRSPGYRTIACHGRPLNGVSASLSHTNGRDNSCHLRPRRRVRRHPSWKLAMVPACRQRSISLSVGSIFQTASQ